MQTERKPPLDKFPYTTFDSANNDSNRLISAKVDFDNNSVAYCWNTA